MRFQRRTLLQAATGAILTSAASSCAIRDLKLFSPNAKEPIMSETTPSPLIVGHRGAPGYLPEHTLAGYRLAAALGADYIEPDLVFTKDGYLVARHDHYLSTTTDIADHPEFVNRKTEKPGHDGADWFTEDFTLAELKTLRARQAMAFRSHAADGMFEIPTFDEVIALAQSEGKRLGRTIGIYPETKSPGYFTGLGFDYATEVLSALKRAGWGGKDAPVFIQSFETPILKELRSKTQLPLIYLLESMSDLSMSEIAQFADGIGPYKELLVDTEGRSNGFVEAAHAAGLKIHPWTFRADQLPDAFQTAHGEFEFFFNLGVDGVFTDFPDAAYAARLAGVAAQEK